MAPRDFTASVPRRRRRPARARGRRPFLLALGQLRVTGGAGRENLARARAVMARAAAAGARVVLLPEAMDLGWTWPGARRRAQPVPGGSFCAALCRAAARHGVYVCAGLTEADGRRVYNTAVLISPRGRVLLRERKLNELAIGHGCYDQGDRLGVVPTPYGTFGVMICADARADGECVARTLGLMGADVVLSPSAWAVPPGWDNGRRPYGREWRESYGAVARDYRVWIAGCSNVGPITAGPWKGHACIGCSLVVDPRGRPVLSGPFGEDAEALLLVRVQPVPRPARGDLWREFHEKTRRTGAGRKR